MQTIHDLGVLIGLTYVALLPFILGALVIWTTVRWWRKKYRVGTITTRPTDEVKARYVFDTPEEKQAALDSAAALRERLAAKRQ
jgi:hypothetical protein